MIYGNFVEVTGKLASQIKFLSKCLKDYDESSRYENIYIEQSGSGFRGVATDRRRMHIVDALAPNYNGIDCGIKEGQWRFLQYKPDELGMAWMAHIPKPNCCYPNYTKATPKGKPEFKKDFELGFTGEFTGTELERFHHFMNTFPEPTAIQPRYLADLEQGEWTVSWYGKDKAVVFERDCYKAVIMPLHFWGNE